MVANSIPDEKELRKLYDKHDGNISHIAKHYGRPKPTVFHWYRRIGMAGRGLSKGGRHPIQKATSDIELPEFADDDIGVKQILDTMETRFEKRWAGRKQKEWFTVKVKINGPIGISFFGDPHIDDNGCNIPLLRHHCQLHEQTEGLFGINIGDTLNNWAGRLIRLYADQDTSRHTAQRLAQWFLAESGITWIAWLMGNHELWNSLPDWMRALNKKAVPMEDWQARLKLVFPNGRECYIWCAHDFSGNSMWNSLHGAQRTAHMKSPAHIYACGHTHNWAMHQEESASEGFTYWLVRSRGYKFVDDYAERLGHFPQKEGASVTCIIDPNADTGAGFVQSFADMDRAVDYLTWARARK